MAFPSLERTIILTLPEMTEFLASHWKSALLTAVELYGAHNKQHGGRRADRRGVETLLSTVHGQATERFPSLPSGTRLAETSNPLRLIVG